MSVSAAVGQNNGDCGTPLPIAPAVGGALQGYTVSIEASPDKPINGVSFSSWTFKFTAKRAPATRAFAILIFISAAQLPFLRFTLIYTCSHVVVDHQRLYSICVDLAHRSTYRASHHQYLHWSPLCPPQCSQSSAWHSKRCRYHC